MKYLVVSDMHGNWDAFEAVLRKVRRKHFDAVLVLGDLVGYGAAPNQVVEAVRDLPWRSHVIRGNHDKVVAGIDDGSNFNFAAFAAARWTTERLTQQNLAYVEKLPRGPLPIEDGLAICHGSPIDEDNYVFSDLDALEVFSGFDCHVTLFGHTHIPSLFSLEDGKLWVQALRGSSGTLELREDGRYLVNPGSIGQPRDRDPRAAYMIFDSDRGIVRWYRIDYPIAKAQQRLKEAELPPMLAERLAVGV